MLWWIICFVSVTITIFAKWYFADNLSRLRQTLSRQHREALEIKDSLTEARKTHQEILMLNKSKDIDIARTRKHIAELRLQLDNKSNAEDKKTGRHRR